MVDKALDYMLAQHEPCPAFVVDRRWNLLRANRGAVALTEFLLGPSPADPAPEPVSLALALMSSVGLRPFIVNRDGSRITSGAASRPTPKPTAPRKHWDC